MKSKMIALVLGMAAIVSAAEVINFNNTFETDADGKPAKWRINELAEYKPFGDIKVIKGENGNSLQMISKGKSVHYYCDMPYNVKAGDTVTIRAKISGKGKISFAGYFYGERKRFCYGYFPMFALPEKPEVVTKSFVVEARPGKPDVKTGYVVLAISAGAEATISELDAEVEPAK